MKEYLLITGGYIPIAQFFLSKLFFLHMFRRKDTEFDRAVFSSDNPKLNTRGVVFNQLKNKKFESYEHNLAFKNNSNIQEDSKDEERFSKYDEERGLQRLKRLIHSRKA